MVAKTLIKALRPTRVAHAHCDLPCGVYDPAQARIEAESVKGCQQKYQDSDDPVFKERAVAIKEERADETPREIVIGGEAEPVEVLGRRLEDRGTGPQHRFRLRTPDGVIDVAPDPASGRWTVEREYAPRRRRHSGPVLDKPLDRSGQ